MKFTVSVVLLLAMVVVPACGGIGGGGNAESTTFINPNLVDGDDSVEASFVEDSPPSEVNTDDIEFGVSVKIENFGQHTIKAGELKVTIEGFNEGDFGLNEKLEGSVDKPILGRRKINGEIFEGIPETKSFLPKITTYRSNLPGGAILTYPFTAKLCYPYETKVSTTICLVQDTLSTETDRACNPKKREAEVQNSAAPVKITSLKQNVAGRDKILLNFKIEKTGSGVIYVNNPTEELELHQNECGQNSGENVNSKTRNRVLVVIDTGLPAEDLECSGLSDFKKKADDLAAATAKTGVARLADNGTATFVCLQDTKSVSSDGIKAISLTLQYQVKKSVTKNVVVKNLTVFDE